MVNSFPQVIALDDEMPSIEFTDAELEDGDWENIEWFENEKVKRRTYKDVVVGVT